MRLAKYDKAESNIADFIRKFPSDKKIDDMNYLMGACLEDSEKYGEAIETYRKVYDNPNSELRAIALFRIGVCYDLMGKPADALDNYRKYAASFPSSSCVKEAENRIDEMLKTK
jgi:TolA-binding protein